jgi:hypothetical protein
VGHHPRIKEKLKASATIDFSFMKGFRSFSLALPIAMLAVFATAGTLKGQQRPAQGKLPFRAKQDGSVDFKDVLELTKQAPSKDRISDAELQEIKDRHKIKYGSEFKPVSDGQQATPARGDYYANSILLTDGANHTVLPNRAVIHLPEKYQERKIEEPKGELILWPDFFKRNRNWIRTEEITLETALGEDPIAEEKLKALEASGVVVVGVLRGSPISVLPPKEADNDTLGGSGGAQPNASAYKTKSSTPANTSRYNRNNTQQQNTTHNRLRK